uniref:NLR family pyrin domain containing 11 n=1 Tax=Prolemur simus TaxID=1328070 RepID=A0A8C8Z8E3_PROSS
MAEWDSTDFDLLLYLEHLSDEQFQSFRNHLQQEIQHLGLLWIPSVDLARNKKELAKVLMTSYETQYTWNMAFSIFQKLGREDLCKKINTRRNQTHKSLMRTKFQLVSETCPFPGVDYSFYFQMIGDIFYALESSYDFSTSSTENLNMFLVGDRAAGKSLFVKTAVVQWTIGEMWKDTISYIIHLSSHEANQVINYSLIQLISKDWPNRQAPVADILSDPQKLLFIFEDLDNMNFDFSVDESLLCSDSRQHVPVSILFLSLLRRKMAPGSWVLISSRPNCDPSIKTLMGKKDCYVSLELSDENKQEYFYLFFKDKQRALTAFTHVLENEILMDLCQVPVLCWIVCTVLKQQMDKGEDIRISCQTPTDIYAHFLASALTSETGVTECGHHLFLLNHLCLLALEGLFNNTLNFSIRDLTSVGFTRLDIFVLQAMNILLHSSHPKDHYKFLHLNIQEFCAAVACMMELPICSIPSAKEKYKEKRELYNDFSPVIISIFGLLNEKKRKILETFLGSQLPKAASFRQNLLMLMRHLGNNPILLEHHMPLFYSLFENQEEELVKEIMGFFLEATIHIHAHTDLMVSLYCLQHCHPLKKLTLCLQHIFENKNPAVKLTPRQTKGLDYWRDICCLLHTKKNLRELEICSSVFDGISEELLSKALGHPNCQLQTLRLSHFSADTEFDNLFRSMVRNRNLTLLNLNGMPISLNTFSLLREILSGPTCSIQHLSFVNCNLQASACAEISSILVSSSNLKKLTLANNPLGDDGARTLCDAVLHPDCVLESLTLFYCCLTERCSVHITKLLMLSKTLKHLDLCVNHLQNYGVLALTFPLSLPECRLQELELSGCFLTSDICLYIAAALIYYNLHLRRLELGYNNIGDAGVELLCRALKYPNCKLETLGLEGCGLTSACCQSLTSVLTSSKTLKTLNLSENDLGNAGARKLVEGLGHPACVLEAFGIRMSDLNEETQRLLIAVREKNTKLLFLYRSFSMREGRQTTDLFASQSHSQPGSTKSNYTWQSAFFKFPRRFASTPEETAVSGQSL